MSFTAHVQRHRHGVYLGTAMLLLAGLVSLYQLPAGAYPEVEFTRIVIVARGGGLEPRDNVVTITRPLEEALTSITGLVRLRSRSVRGAAELNLDFRAGADMRFALQQVQNRIESVRPSLPGGLEIDVERLTPSVFPMMQYELTGASPSLLRDLAQYTIRPRLARLTDVGLVEVEGGLVREVSVAITPAALAAHRISVAEVADAIRASNIISASGRFDQQYRQYSVMVSGLVNTPEALAGIVVPTTGGLPVRVGDLGQVAIGTEDQFQLATGDGAPAALINVSRQPNGSTLAVERAVEHEVVALQRDLPTGVKLQSVYNQGALIRDSIASVRDAMLIGAVLAVVVLLLFLGQMRTALIAALTIPLALAGAMAGLTLAGDSINLMSLGGLAVAIGLIIDDAVVVVENIERHWPGLPGVPLRETIRAATDQILAPVAGSTLTTIVVFAPLGLLEGVVGQFFRSFSLALASAVLLSLVLSVTLIPVLAEQFHRPRDANHKPWAARLLDSLLDRYERLLGRLLGHPMISLGAVAIVVVVMVVTFRSIGTGFLPEMDEGGFILDYWTPTGTSLTETDRQVHHLEQILKADPDVQAFTRRTGAELGFFATAPNTGDMTVQLRPRNERTASVYQVIDRVRRQSERELPAVRVEFVQILQDLIGDLAGSAEPVEIKLFHGDVATAELAARTVAAAIDSVAGLVDLFDGITGKVPQLSVNLDPLRVARLGLTTTTAAEQVHAALLGASAGSIREGDRLVPIRVHLTDKDRFDPAMVAALPIVGPAGWSPLNQLGQVSDSADIAELSRENLRPVVRVTGAVDQSRSNLGAVMSGIGRALRGVQLPAGTTLEIGGQDAGRRAAFRQLLLVLVLAAGAVLLVLVLQFRDYRGPLAIVAAAILGLSGGIAALAVTGIPFNVSSFMGLILLIGLVVKNGIIFLDSAHTHLSEGATPRGALAAAGRVRMRPILMTTACTLAGLLPLALGLGAGAELQRPLAVVVIGGLAFSTLVTLLLLPVAFDLTGALGATES